MTIHRSSAAGLALAGLIITGASGTTAQETKVMPLPQVKNILKITGDSWIKFRDYGGQQLIYFTHLISWKCGLKEIRYSLNGDGLAERFPIPKCNPLLPNNIGADDKIYLTGKLNGVETVAVQLLFDDDAITDIHIYRPCPGAAEATCAQRTETRAAAE